MAYLDPMRITLSGDEARARAHVRTARVLALALAKVNGEAGVTTGRRSIRTKDGVTIEVTQAGLEMSAHIHAGGGAMEEVIHAYIRSEDGLRVLDLGSKSSPRVFNGLEAFEADATTESGAYVYMTSAISALLARVDTLAVEAFAVSQTVAAAHAEGSGLARFDRAYLSPSENFVVATFASTVNGSGVLLDGMGGILMFNAEDLTAVRPAIRMGIREHCAAWAANDRLYINAKRNTDLGDVMDTSYAESLQDSQTDYVVEFDAEGTLVGSLLLYTWPSPPGGGFSNTIQYLLANKQGTRLYTIRRPATGDTDQRTFLDVIDIDGSMALITSFRMSIRAESMDISHDGTKIFAIGIVEDSVAPVVEEIAVADDDIASTAVAEHAQFAAQLTAQTLNGGPLQPLKRSVTSKVQLPPDPRRFLLNSDKFLLAFHQFTDGNDDPAEPSYEFDLTEYNVGNRFVLFNAGARPRPPQ